MTAAGSCSSGICNLEREYLFCASKHGQVELGVVAKKPGRRGKFHTLLEPSYLLKSLAFISNFVISYVILQLSSTLKNYACSCCIICLH